ncbi:MAG: hypothetical protein H7X80_11525, partial [bacterium]|nr:hypothetical protein [Candidatus Kapabacteria bacterium]
MSSLPERELTRIEQQELFLSQLLPLRTRLAQFSRAMTGDYESGRDLMSDTIVAAYEHFDKVREPVAFLSYLFTIATRLHRRQRARERNRVQLDDHMLLQLASLSPSPDS